MRGKILNSILMLSLILASLLAFGISPAFAPSTTLTAPQIVNPLKAPGQTLTINIQINYVTLLATFEINMSFNPAHLQCIGYAPTGAAPVYMVIDPAAPQGIDNTAGLVWFGGKRNPTYGGGLTVPTATQTGPLPIATITFNILTRATSVLDILDSTWLKNTSGVIISPVNVIDGYFDNRFQGKMYPDTVVNDVMPGDEFTLDIYVTDTNHLWGFEFDFTYDTNILSVNDPSDVQVLAPMSGGALILDDSWGYIHILGSYPIAEKYGLTTSVPVAVVRIKFHLDMEGWSALYISNLDAANTAGSVQIFDVASGGFSSEPIQVDLVDRGAWPDTHVFRTAQQAPNTIDTMYAKVETNNTVTMMVSVLFTVTDAVSGVVITTIDTGIYELPGGYMSQMIVTSDFDTAAWGEPRYHVLIYAQAWVDITGDGVGDFAGARIKGFSILVRS